MKLACLNGTSRSAVKLGKVLNVKFLVVGTFGKLLDQYVLSFRVIDVETAKAIYSDDARSLSSQSQVANSIGTMVRKMIKSVARNR